MKKIMLLLLIAALPLIVSGCSSNITAKYDDYNETFSGKTYYDSLSRRATIDIKSDKNNAICTGHGYMYMYPMWEFDLLCSDGRSIKGLIPVATVEGKAFTNRNETITFSVAKKQSTINNANKNYYSQIQNKPQLDNSKEHIKVIMQK